MSALCCLFLCFRSYSEKLEEYIPTFYKIRDILEELYVAVIWIISQLIIYIDQMKASMNGLFFRQFSMHFMYNQNIKQHRNLKEKENLFSVRGFETETSNFAPNGCPRVSTDQKFYARSDGMLRIIPRLL